MTLVHLKTDTYEQAKMLEHLLNSINFVHDVTLDNNELNEFTISKLEESAELYKTNPSSFLNWDNAKSDLLNKL
jgi:hypothetical protein